ncbi:MAG TPA: hypothetical protein VMY37_15710 [Thermoguttaceae bacterium]|nr:hypothetical protein [Thermoguttaceae bacterium]
MKTLLAALALAIGSASLVCAEPLASTHVPADAKWLVHIDVDAIKTGKVARAIGALWLNLPAGAEHLKRVGAVVGLDPAEDLRGITIYGGQYAEPAAVVILRTKVDRKRLMAFLEAAPGYRIHSYGEHELVEWTANRRQSSDTFDPSPITKLTNSSRNDIVSLAFHGMSSLLFRDNRPLPECYPCLRTSVTYVPGLYRASASDLVRKGRFAQYLPCAQVACDPVAPALEPQRIHHGAPAHSPSGPRETAEQPSA